MDDGNPIIGIVMLLILLLINGIFSGTEIAVSALSESVLKKQAEDGHKKADKILKIAQEPEGFIHTIHLVLTISTVLMSIFIITPMIKAMTLFVQIQTGCSFYICGILVSIGTLFIIVYLINVISIEFPKRLAYKYASTWAYMFINWVSFTTVILRPLLWLIQHSVNLLVHIAGINPKDIEENVTEEEIIMMVSEGHEQGMIEASEAQMISNIFEFDDKEVSDIMTHRRNICAVNREMTLMEAAELMARERYSRYPVYEDDVDNIIGILHLKDVMRRVVSGDINESITDVMRKPLFVPDTQNINTLFKDMQARKIHMAIVVDEYGQSCGLVAMEDILEVIVGSILDEYDLEEEYIQKIGGAYLIKGMTQLEDITDLLGIEFDDDFETLNGWMIAEMNHIPKQSEQASFDYEGYTFKVIAVKDNFINQVKVTKITG